MKILTTWVLLSILSVFTASAQEWTIQEPNSTTQQLEYAAQCVNRLCPAPMWDSWTFEKMAYDQKTNTVIFTIRLRNWNGKKKEKTQADGTKMAKWIAENFMEGYNEVSKSAEVFVDGDWMLYLLAGSVMRKAAKDDASLSITLLKPDGSRVTDYKMTVTSNMLRSITENTD